MKDEDIEKMIKKKEDAPESLWTRLEASLDERESKKVRAWGLSGILENLKNSLVLRPVAGFAVILFLSMTAYQVNHQKTLAIEPRSATMTVLDVENLLAGTDFESEDESLGSAVEMLFN